MIPIPPVAVIAKAALDFIADYWIWILIGVLVLAVGVQTKRVGRAKAETAKVQAAFDQFKGGVEALGREAERKAAAQKAADEKRKRDADAENKQAHEVLNADNARLAALRDRLRRERDAARGRLVPAAPAGSRCADGQACFERAELEAALQRHRERVRGLSDRAAGLAQEGSEIEADLNTARKWAQERAAP